MLAIAAPASAGESPIPGGVTCTQELKKSYRVGAVAKRGLPVGIRCTGPARVVAIPSFGIPSKAADDLLQMFSGGIPGIARSKGPTTVPESGRATARKFLMPYAVRIVRRYRRTPIISVLAVEREDGSFRSIPSENRRTKLVR